MVRRTTPLQIAGLGLTLLLAAGCGARMGGTGSQERNVITREMIAETSANNVYEAVERLRPQWLTSRGPTSLTDPSLSTAAVFMDGVEAGGLDFMRGVMAWDVEHVRYWTAGEASNRFGMGYPRGVIELVRSP